MDTRNKIVECGIEMFKKDGYENVTIPKICEAANISKGTFYYHFASKNEIIYEYVSNATQSISEIMPDVLSISNAYEQLWLIFEHTFQALVGLGPKLLKSYYQADIENGLKQLANLDYSNYDYSIMQHKKLIFSIINRGQKNGEITNRASAEELFNTYSAAVTGIGLDWSCHDGNFDKIAMDKKIFEIIFRK